MNDKITQTVHFNIYNFAGKIGKRSELEGSDRVPAINHRNRHTVPTPYLYLQAYQGTILIPTYFHVFHKYLVK